MAAELVTARISAAVRDSKCAYLCVGVRGSIERLVAAAREVVVMPVASRRRAGRLVEARGDGFDMPSFVEAEWVQKRLEDAAQQKESRASKAEMVIWAAVGINAGLGIVPFGINIWAFVGVVTAMVVTLGTIYGYHYSHDDAADLIKHIFVSAGATSTFLGLGLKFFTEVLKGVGVITLGGATVAGMALDAILCGAVAYAVGYTTKKYFDKERKMTDEEIRSEFKTRFREGKTEVRRMTTKTD
jgi:uncharacterized protein (DUF697 family)